MSILKIKNESGKWVYIPTVKGEKGDKGDSYILTAADKAEIAGMINIPVDDVQVGGVSVVQNGVANVPIGASGVLGVVKDGNAGVNILSDGTVRTAPALSNSIKSGSVNYNPIAPLRQHEAVFYGLAKAAGHDEKDSTLEIGQYTDEAKAAIKSMLGVQDAMVVRVTGTGAIRSVDHTFAEIAAALGSGISVIVDDTDAAQPYVGLVNLNGAVSLAFGVSATYNGVSTLTGYLITDMGDGTVAIRVEQNTNIVSDVKVNGTSVVDGGVASISVTDGKDGKDGKDGVDGVSPTATVEAVTGGAKVTITDKNGTTVATLTNGQNGQPGAAGQPGEKGDPGTPGAAGKDGEDGFSPSAKVTQTTSGATISITDKTGTTSATITNGKDGAPGAAGTPGAAGKDGEDGFSPSAKVTQTTSGATISITDKTGTTSATITNGKDGKDGAAGSPGAAGKDGEDGFSPSAKVEAVTGGAKITITDKSGTTTTTITNGEKGDKGDPGTDAVSPTAKVQAVTGGAKITITDKNGTTTATVTNGTNGSPGAAGKDGADGFSPTAKVTQTTSGATISITDKSGTTSASISNGTDGAPGGKGDTGERGTGILKVTTAPTSYTTQTGGFTPKFRISLSTVKSQAGVDKVLVGDVLIYSYNHYVVGYVDSDYVYIGAATSFRGAKGATGTAGTSPAASVAQTSTGATITITDATGTTTATVTNGAAGAKGDKGDPGDDYVLTAQDKTDIAEIVSENGIFYETHQMEQVVRINDPDLHWVNTSGKLSGISSKKYIFDADGVQDVVQLTRAQDADNKYYYGGTSETLGITLVYYYGDTKNSYIDFTNTVTTFKIFNYSTPVRAEIKGSYELGARLTQLIQYAVDDYYDNGDTSYYG